ncbi:MAG: glycine cleavage system protein GcvH [Candidatus Delongbacteria bacterium]|nr:glycine cleavage system protein GcvH [Candidatus Delongbacteria bacterium]MBN2835586.1 glycine cleavage system protein GcvH [Candidatus Delongbacteria bacterium]
MKVVEGLFYTDDHEYLKVEGEYAYVGVTDYAQQQLGDITYIELPSVGDTFDKGDSFGTIEAVKAASDLYIPVAGEVVEVNEELNDNPETVNQDCYEKGWIIKIKMTEPSDVEDLMDAEAYKAHISE